VARKTRTSPFGASRREGHDASAFYGRRLYAGTGVRLLIPDLGPVPAKPSVPPRPVADWCDALYCQSSERMSQIPDGAVHLAFTSPPYNAGKDFDDDLSLLDYLRLIRSVAGEVHRVLVPGGRYVVNVANLGRNPYIPMGALFHAVHADVGFLPMGEIIWRKGNGMNGNCAWGSWRSAKAPRLRDLHEYLLVFAKGQASRPDRGPSDISAEEFMAATLSVWDIPAESARRVGHPAPFPEALAERVIRLYSYRGDVVLDPFVGSGTTCVAARRLGRRYVGYDVVADYVHLAEARLARLGEAETPPATSADGAPTRSPS
jgi:DNA modification methylase